MTFLTTLAQTKHRIEQTNRMQQTLGVVRQTEILAACSYIKWLARCIPSRYICGIENGKLSKYKIQNFHSTELHKTLEKVI